MKGNEDHSQGDGNGGMSAGNDGQRNQNDSKGDDIDGDKGGHGRDIGYHNAGEGDRKGTALRGF